MIYKKIDLVKLRKVLYFSSLSLSTRHPPKNSMECVLCKAVDNLRTINNFYLCNPCYQTSLNDEKEHIATHVFTFSAPNQITDKIYVGDQDSACDLSQLKERGITHILIVGTCLTRHFDKGITYLQLLMDDSLEQALDPYVDMGLKFIDEADGKVLIHCYSGISRSGAITVAHLMKTNKWSYDTALSYAKSKRKQLSPNSNFKAQLEKIYESLMLSN